jgi:hypothetical protein
MIESLDTRTLGNGALPSRNSSARTGVKVLPQLAGNSQVLGNAIAPAVFPKAAQDPSHLAKHDRL